jgi:hypothetical protein
MRGDHSDMATQERNAEGVSLYRSDTPYPAMLLIGQSYAGAGGVSAFTFPPAGVLPTNFAHLCAKISARSMLAANNDRLYCRINGGGGANYNVQRITGNAAAVAAAESIGATAFDLTLFWPGATASAGLFTTMEVWFTDYTNGNKYPTFTAKIFGPLWHTTGTIWQAELGGLYFVLGAITSISFFFNGSNLDQYSCASLYGIYG